MEREHQLAREPFPRWMVLGEQPQFSGHQTVPATAEVGSDTQLKYGESFVLQRGQLVAQPTAQRHVRQRLPAPQVKRGARGDRCGQVVTRRELRLAQRG